MNDDQNNKFISIFSLTKSFTFFLKPSEILDSFEIFIKCLS